MSESVTPCHTKEAEEQARNVVVFDARKATTCRMAKKKRQSQNRWGAMREGSEKAVKV